MGLSFSPIKGPEGNIEYLAWLRKGSHAPRYPIDPQTVTAASHEALKD